MIPFLLPTFVLCWCSSRRRSNFLDFIMTWWRRIFSIQSHLHIRISNIGTWFWQGLCWFCFCFCLWCCWIRVRHGLCFHCCFCDWHRRCVCLGMRCGSTAGFNADYVAGFGIGSGTVCGSALSPSSSIDCRPSIRIGRGRWRGRIRRRIGRRRRIIIIRRRRRIRRREMISSRDNETGCVTKATMDEIL